MHLHLVRDRKGRELADSLATHHVASARAYAILLAGTPLISHGQVLLVDFALVGFEAVVLDRDLLFRPIICDFAFRGVCIFRPAQRAHRSGEATDRFAANVAWPAADQQPDVVRG
jgi:hypothetical protein